MKSWSLSVQINFSSRPENVTAVAEEKSRPHNFAQFRPPAGEAGELWLYYVVNLLARLIVRSFFTSHELDRDIYMSSQAWSGAPRRGLLYRFVKPAGFCFRVEKKKPKKNGTDFLHFYVSLNPLPDLIMVWDVENSTRTSCGLLGTLFL